MNKNVYTYSKTTILIASTMFFFKTYFAKKKCVSSNLISRFQNQYMSSKIDTIEIINEHDSQVKP